MLAFSTVESQRHINAHPILLTNVIIRLSDIKNIKILVDTAAVLPGPSLDSFYPPLPLYQRLGPWVGLLAVGLSVRARGYEPKQHSAGMSGWVLQLLLPLFKALRTSQRETRVVPSHPSIHLGLLRWNTSDRPSENQEKEKQNITNSGEKQTNKQKTMPPEQKPQSQKANKNKKV